jgi:hypothetical protein
MNNAPLTNTDDTAEASLNYLTFNLNNQFIYKSGGDEKKLGSEVEIVIMGINPPKNFINERAYWPGKFGDSEGAPECGSPDGVKPHAFLEAPQARVCDKCKWSQPGSALTQGKGKKSTQCRSFKMIYFVFADNVVGELSAFRVPVTSLKSLSGYRWDLKKAGAPIAGVITKVSFDEEAEYTRPMFTFAKFLDEKGFGFCTELAASSETSQLMDGSRQVAAIEDKSDTVAVADYTESTIDPPKLKPAEEAVSHVTPVGDSPDVDIDDLLGISEEVVEEPTPYQLLLCTANACNSLADLKGFIAGNGRQLLAGIVDKDESAQAIAALKNMAAKLSQPSQKELGPLGELKERLSVLNNREQLPVLLADIRTLGGEALTLLPDFVALAGKLNEETFNPAVHGMSKDGFPALKKSGEFRQKKGVAKEIAPSDIDDILGDLEEA